MAIGLIALAAASLLNAKIQANRNKGQGGGSSFSEGASQGLSGSVQNLFGPQAENLTNLGGYTSNLLNQFQGNPQDLIAGFNPLQQQGQQLSQQAPLQDIFNQTRQGFGQALNTDISQNPFFQSSVQASLNPFIRSFQQQVLPNIRSQAVGVGQEGSSREGIAQGMAN